MALCAHRVPVSPTGLGKPRRTPAAAIVARVARRPREPNETCTLTSSGSANHTLRAPVKNSAPRRLSVSGLHFVIPAVILFGRFNRPHRITTGLRGAHVTKKLYIRTFGCQM